MRNQTNTYMIQGEKMSCICLYVNPMGKKIIRQWQFQGENKRTTMICSQLL
jgi:hypothetical protein